MSSSVRLASLGSGSKGNGTLVDDGETCLLVDLGFSLKETIRRLARLELTPADVDAILVTHEHADHIHGVAAFARKFSIPVYLSHGTYSPKRIGELPSLTRINSHVPFQLGSFQVVPVAVPHDAKEPCQYVLISGGVNVGILTDLGHITPHVIDSYKECDALLLECNHDVQMLQDGSYPYPLKQRVAGDYGHLNNQQASSLLTEINLDRLRHLVISHVSEQNNSPELARDAVLPNLDGWDGSLIIADQQAGFDWFSIN